jgi:hypothetical protein
MAASRDITSRQRTSACCELGIDNEHWVESARRAARGVADCKIQSRSTRTAAVYRKNDAAVG